MWLKRQNLTSAEPAIAIAHTTQITILEIIYRKGPIKQVALTQLAASENIMIS